MNYEPITLFLDRVRKLNKSNKDMRLSYDEANALAVTLAQLLTETVKKQSEQLNAPRSTVIDGGSFPKS